MTTTTIEAAVRKAKGAAKKGAKARRKMTESAALWEKAAATRIIKPVVVKGVELATKVTLIPPSQFKRLNVDETYQRLKVGHEINSLIQVLKAGGQIADPVDIAERPDGSWWIVDGQQRFWAHDECQVPLRANIHKVADHSSETQLFLTLNARTKITPRVMIKGWPGPAGDFIRRLHESEMSPIHGLIDFSQSTNLPLDAPTVLKGILAVTTGSIPNGETSTRLLPRLDVALKVTGMTAWAEAFIQLLAAVFDMNKGAGRVRVLPVVALARVAHRRYVAAQRPVFPSSCAGLRRVNWDTIVPTHASRYMPVLESEIEKRWK